MHKEQNDFARKIDFLINLKLKTFEDFVQLHFIGDDPQVEDQEFDGSPAEPDYSMEQHEEIKINQIVISNPFRSIL